MCGIILPSDACASIIQSLTLYVWPCPIGNRVNAWPDRRLKLIPASEGASTDGLLVTREQSHSKATHRTFL
jgi:hypothetical protein